MEGWLLIGAIKRGLVRMVYGLIGSLLTLVASAWIIAIASLLLGCAAPLRMWTGQPPEHFPGDRADCYQSAIFEECMHGKGWKEYTQHLLEEPKDERVPR
jgi:hypothetical protein